MLAFSTSPCIKTIQSRTIHERDHDFSSTRLSSPETKINDKLLPLPSPSLSSSFSLSLSLLLALRTKRSMRTSAIWKFKFPREEEEAESEWPPACTLCSKEIDFARACSRASSGSWYSGTGWLEKKFSPSGTGQTKLAILCKRCCVSGGGGGRGRR